MNLFENELIIAAEELAVELRPRTWIPWADFILNPRRLRGSDFLMRWSQGVWSEDRLVQAIHETGAYFTLPYGPSGTAPDNDVREFELYFERLEAAGLERFSNGFSRERDVECGDLSPLSVIAAKKRRQVAALQKLNANEIRSRQAETSRPSDIRKRKRIGDRSNS
jgi:hypothetical protein